MFSRQLSSNNLTFSEVLMKLAQERASDPDVLTPYMRRIDDLPPYDKSAEYVLLHLIAQSYGFSPLPGTDCTYWFDTIELSADGPYLNLTQMSTFQPKRNYFNDCQVGASQMLFNGVDLSNSLLSWIVPDGHSIENLTLLNIKGDNTLLLKYDRPIQLIMNSTFENSVIGYFGKVSADDEAFCENNIFNHSTFTAGASWPNTGIPSNMTARNTTFAQLVSVQMVLSVLPNLHNVTVTLNGDGKNENIVAGITNNSQFIYEDVQSSSLTFEQSVMSSEFFGKINGAHFKKRVSHTRFNGERFDSSSIALAEHCFFNPATTMQGSTLNQLKHCQLHNVTLTDVSLGSMKNSALYNARIYASDLTGDYDAVDFTDAVILSSKVQINATALTNFTGAFFSGSSLSNSSLSSGNSLSTNTLNNVDFTYTDIKNIQLLVNAEIYKGCELAPELAKLGVIFDDTTTMRTSQNFLCWPLSMQILVAGVAPALFLLLVVGAVIGLRCYKKDTYAIPRRRLRELQTELDEVMRLDQRLIDTIIGPNLHAGSQVVLSRIIAATFEVVSASFSENDLSLLFQGNALRKRVQNIQKCYDRIDQNNFSKVAEMILLGIVPEQTPPELRQQIIENIRKSLDVEAQHVEPDETTGLLSGIERGLVN